MGESVGVALEAVESFVGKLLWEGLLELSKN